MNEINAKLAELSQLSKQKTEECGKEESALTDKYGELLDDMCAIHRAEICLHCTKAILKGHIHGYTDKVKCAGCGTRISERDKFCSQCGAQNLK
jgi:hypothetical protein